jgi:diguanylate cyclase (GGDEF)-like protein
VRGGPLTGEPEAERPRRSYFFISGPVLGLAAAWIWGDRSAGWLASGAVLGLAAELLGAIVSEREAKPGSRVVSFFLTFQTVLAAIPFLVLSGLIDGRAAAYASFRVWHLAFVPIASLAATIVRERLRPADPGERRARPREGDPPRYQRWLWIAGALATLAFVATADARTPSPYSLDFLYLGPTLIVAWMAGWRAGMLVGVLAAESRGIVRGFSYPGGLEPLLVGLDFAVVAVGLGAGAVALGTISGLVRREVAAARTDPLTGLHNRKAFLDRVDQEVARVARDGGFISIAYLDLDGFKAVNDNHGHAAGDEVLKIVASAIRTSIRAEDEAARLGGDEFAILLTDADPDVAPRIAGRIRTGIVNHMDDYTWDVTCSLGVVTSSRAVGSTEELLRHADQLMYEVKREGKNALKQMVID